MTHIGIASVRYWAPAAVVGALALSASALSADKPGVRPAPKARPAAAATPTAVPPRLPGYNPDRNAYFGDLHVHTHLSFDAYIFNVRRTPDDAYRFAKGETIEHAGGFDVRLAGRPLDFVAVTDHAEYMGAMREAADPASPLSKLPIVRGLFSPDPARIAEAFNTMVRANDDGTLPAEFSDRGVASRAWAEVREAAARHNQPGRFTTFIGYEYTSAPDRRNLHRNVIFRSARVADLPPGPLPGRGSTDPLYRGVPTSLAVSPDRPRVLGGRIALLRVCQFGVAPAQWTGTRRLNGSGSGSRKRWWAR